MIETLLFFIWMYLSIGFGASACHEWMRSRRNPVYRFQGKRFVRNWLTFPWFWAGLMVKDGRS